MIPVENVVIGAFGLGSFLGGMVSTAVSDARHKRAAKKFADDEAARKAEIPNPLYTLIAAETDPRSLEQHIEKWVKDFEEELAQYSVNVTRDASAPRNRIIFKRNRAYVHAYFDNEKYVSIHYPAVGHDTGCNLLYFNEQLKDKSNEEQAMVVLDTILKKLNAQ